MNVGYGNLGRINPQNDVSLATGLSSVGSFQEEPVNKSNETLLSKCFKCALGCAAIYGTYGVAVVLSVGFEIGNEYQNGSGVFESLVKGVAKGIVKSPYNTGNGICWVCKQTPMLVGDAISWLLHK